MRFALAVLLVISLTAVILASPAKNKQAPSLPACSRNCGDVYEPVCAKAKQGSKERLLTFGNQCVLEKFNCEHGDDKYEVKSNGECGGNVSVRLS